MDDSQKRSPIDRNDSIDIQLVSPGHDFGLDILDNRELLKKVEEKTSSSIGQLSARVSFRSSALENPGIKWNVHRKSAIDLKSEALNSTLRSLDKVGQKSSRNADESSPAENIPSPHYAAESGKTDQTLNRPDQILKEDPKEIEACLDDVLESQDG